MQGCGSSSFLERLKNGGAVTALVDNSAPPTSDGVIIRRIERENMKQPLSVLGLKLSDDGEILSIEANSPAAKANILPNFMITFVNDRFVGSRNDFEDIATQSLTLIIKLQTTNAMTELIAKILEEEEKSENENGKYNLDINELLRTTPRYGFLSAEHPMFLRWNQRIQTQREARQLLREATREAEEQMAKEASEKIRKELEAEEAKQRELQSISKPVVKSIPDVLPKQTEEFLLRQVQDESSFGRVEEVIDAMDEVNKEPSTEELLKLIGAERNEEKASVNVLPEDDAGVRFFIIPTEEYRLSNGMRVTISVKQRSGPIPRPPPGKPPKDIRGLGVNKGHSVDDCIEKNEQERKLAMAPKERQICRDFMRGRCTRSDCMMQHVSQHGRSRSRSPPSRKRDRNKRHRSRDRHRREESRKRRHHSRRRSRRDRSGSAERHRRRR